MKWIIFAIILMKTDLQFITKIISKTQNTSCKFKIYIVFKLKFY